MDLGRVQDRAAASVHSEQLLSEILAAPVFSRGSLLRHVALTAPAGIACEFGVFQGDSLRQIRSYRKPPLFGFDSWQGLPETWATGGEVAHPAGHFACTVPGDFANGVTLVQGWFSDTLPGWLEENTGPVQLLHIDCDLYSSTQTVLRALNDRIQSGSVILFDELVDMDNSNYPNWREGEWRALLEWQEEFEREVCPVGRTTHQQVAFTVTK
jgi:methyltransferase family protein